MGFSLVNDHNNCAKPGTHVCTGWWSAKYRNDPTGQLHSKRGEHGHTDVCSMGLSQLLIGIIYVAVLWRYKALIPLMYLLMILEYGLRIVLGTLKPIETTSTAPGAIGDYVMVPLAIIMLILSLREN
jgi:hypothetical protein